ncbi:MAG: HD-GYP domain-containing protein [Spirochaetota bacterium]
MNAAATMEHTQISHMSHKNILIVDDVPENLDLLSDVLLREGCEVRALPSGRLALQSIKNSKPDLILLDISMPEMDGYEVCERIKADPATRDIPVIFISAISETFDKVRAFRTGGVDYIVKPFQVEEVRARIRTHIRMKELQNNLEADNNRLQERVQQQVREIAEAQLSTILAIVKLAEARDDDTGQHIERTRTYAKLIAQALHDRRMYADTIDQTFIHNIFVSSPLHDIGKIAVPDAILLKPGKLNHEEFEIMKQHPVYGARTLNDVRKLYPNNSFINMGIEIARSHHEKWDGSGYPAGLKGEKIPLAARIMAISDVYDALRSKRVYKEAFSHEKSIDIISDATGTHFDPYLVPVFLSIEENIRQVREELDE